MEVSSLLVTLGFLWTGCFCLPNECGVQKFKYSSTVSVDCSGLSLVTVPDDIPSNTGRLIIAFNDIRNITYLPSLPQLYKLDLSYNSIESVSWMSLRTLPALATLLLQGNRLKYVKLDVVIEHLPKLKIVNLSFNKLASFSQHALGWPQVTEAIINNNPFHCDCDLSWLIVKMACLQACKSRDRQECCSSCSACFIHMTPSGRFDCKSPSQLHERHLSAVATQLTDCGSTHRAKTQLQSVENDIFLINGSGNTATQTLSWKKESYKSNSSVMITTKSSTNQTGAYTSPTKSMDTKKEKGKDYTILDISISVIVTCLTLTFIACIIMKINLLYNRREDDNIDHHAIDLRQIVPPMENTLYHGPVAGGSNHRHPVVHEMARTLPTGTSTHVLDNVHVDVSGEDQIRQQIVNSVNHSTSAEGLNHETVAVSNNTEPRVDSSFKLTATSRLYTYTEPTIGSTNYMYSTSAEGSNHEQ